ncbi:MerR family transcriptional regulator [Bifidobacterium eulemuris]|uniref:MerR family transcriptional regulator n=1 Tax=Bifidobacterium eulemuris TaxID=1765219 RepID=A0A261GD11_9BIFI|nr:MerR family transcriptional regulator [Bifidobacterium eulemuris]OZG69331.1 transcriptional regulator, MerR family [Bifidobacterium eulemuris]QOL31173.1 MerR family transcriptional regulator [Bifidobacterium eulemuris]
MTQQNTTTSRTQWHTIREASLLSGLSESTLRYYEQIGIIPPVARDPSSGHRVYSEHDIDVLQTISCMNAIGMSLDAMRQYLGNATEVMSAEMGDVDPLVVRERAKQQVELLDAQALRLAEQLERIKIQQSYCAIKTMYWNAVAEGRADAECILDENRDLFEQVRRVG